jgi:hypothetical protein
MQLDLYLTSAVQVITVLVNDKQSPIFAKLPLTIALFDAIFSMLGLLNPNIHSDNISLKFGFLTLLQMLKSLFAADPLSLNQT